MLNFCMLNFFNLFKRKPRIIPFNTLRGCEKNLIENFRKLTPEDKCKVLGFARSLPPAEKQPPERCKLDFIWDHLNQNKEPRYGRY